MKAGSPIQCSMPHVPFETLGISVSCLDIDTAMPYCVRHLQLQADSVTYWFHSSRVLVRRTYLGSAKLETSFYLEVVAPHNDCLILVFKSSDKCIPNN